MKWLSQDIGTAAFDEMNGRVSDPMTSIVDVRDLVDKAGNDVAYIRTKIDDAIGLLRNSKKIIICCDYGMSRSNSIAIGVLVKWLNIPFADAVEMAKKVVEESGIKIEMLNTVYDALYDRNGEATNKCRAGNICITGANGFLGRSLVRAAGPEFNLSCPTSREIDLMGNVVGLDLLIKNKRIDTIVHLANPRIVTTTGAMGDTLVMLKNILDICRTNGVRLIYLSGWEIYSGYRSAALIANESLEANPKGTYGETKWLAESLIRQYGNAYSIDYLTIRSGPVYGAGGEKPKFVYNFTDKARKNQKILTHKYLNGPPSLDLLYVDDLVAFLVKALQSGHRGEVNIGSGVAVSTLEIATMIRDMTGSTSEIGQVEIRDYAPNIIMDHTVASKLFLWEPLVDVRTGIGRVLENY